MSIQFFADMRDLLGYNPLDYWYGVLVMLLLPAALNAIGAYIYRSTSNVYHGLPLGILSALSALMLVGFVVLQEYETAIEPCPSEMLAIVEIIPIIVSVTMLAFYFGSNKVGVKK